MLENGDIGSFELESVYTIPQNLDKFRKQCKEYYRNFSYSKRGIT